MTRKFYITGVSLFLMVLLGCQMQNQDRMDVNRITPRSVTFNYILIHGMCMGYLGSLSSISVEKFKTLVQKDQNAKFYVVLALTQPNQQNLQLAQNSIQDMVDFIQPPARNGQE